MSSEYAVQFKNVSKIYTLKGKQSDTVRRKFYALKDVSFQIKKGEVVGVLGTNGSGKSTLSSILSEISTPDHGSIEVNGEQALIAINSGLNNQLTGYENIELKGALLGLSKQRVKEITEGVVEFSELGDFLYQPVKNYSSGMKSRLGFSISICLNPDIIIVDEALSVGDKAFAEKCPKEFERLKLQGKTIFFISHSLAQVKSFCTTGLWIEAGTLKRYGEINEVAQEYSDYMDYLKNLKAKEKKAWMNEIFKSRLIEEKRNPRFKLLKELFQRLG